MAGSINTSYGTQYFYNASDYAGQFFSLDEEEAYSGGYWADPPTTPTNSLAIDILNMFGLSLADTRTSAYKGNGVPGYDIVNKDAYEMIQLSLAGELVSTTGHFVECYADEDGNARFYDIGTNDPIVVSYINPGTGDWTNGGNSSLKAFYAIRQMEMKKTCNVVLVFGYDPPETRVLAAGTQLVSGITDTIHSPSEIFGVTNTADTEAYIEYDDTTFKSIAAQNAVFKVVDSKWAPQQKILQRVDGFLYSVDARFANPEMRLEFRQTTTRYSFKSGFGELQPRNWVSSLDYVAKADVGSKTTVNGIDISSDDGAHINGITGVYILGYHAKGLSVDETRNEDGSINSRNSSFLASVETKSPRVYKLSENEDYVTTGNTIVFSANTSPALAAAMSPSATYRISPTVIYNADGSPIGSDYYGSATDNATGYLLDGTSATAGTYYSANGFFPTGDGDSGYLVDNTVITYDVDRPCVAVFDPSGEATYEAGLISVTAYPLLVKELGQYGAYRISDAAYTEITDENREVDLPDPRSSEFPVEWGLGADSEVGADPLQAIMNVMKGSDIRISLPYLTGEKCKEMAEKIFTLQNDIAYMTTYTCSPDSTPVLGQKVGDGGVINSIEYSYQDESQYMISVQVGPIWQGLGSWDMSLRKNTTQRRDVEGTVCFPPGKYISVYVPGEGVITCLNGQMQYINEGDKVKVSIHNDSLRI